MAAGRYHFSRWLGRDHDASAPGAADKHVFTRIRPSPEAETILISLIVQGGSDRQEITFKGTGTPNATTVAIPAGVYGGSQDALPPTLTEILYVIDVSSYQGELFEIWWTCEAVNILKCVTVFDSPLPVLPNVSTGFADLTKQQAGRILTSESIGELAGAQTQIARNYRRSVWNNAPVINGGDYLANMAIDSSWRNALEGTGGTVGWDEDAPGFWYRPSATYGEDPSEKPLIRIWARAQTLGGAGENSELKFVHQTAEGINYESVPIAINGATAWYTTTMELPSPDSYKIQEDLLIQVLAKEGDTPTGVLEVYACSAEELNRSKGRSKVLISSKAKTGNQAVSVVAPTWTLLTELSHTFTVVSSSTLYELVIALLGAHSAAAQFGVGWSVDGGTTITPICTGGAANNFDFSASIPITGLTPGSVTIDLYAVVGAASTTTYWGAFAAWGEIFTSRSWLLKHP
jgi:hypothetical protein